jgi:hypothetical protein
VDKAIGGGIYWDLKNQNSSRATQLKKRFEDQIPLMIGKYNWAKDYKVTVNTYSEDKTDRGY